MQAYDDEAEVLTALAAALRAAGRGELARPLDEALGRVRRLQQADRRLMSGDGTLAPAGSGGLSGRVRSD